jgi:hypothetical protein
MMVSGIPYSYETPVPEQRSRQFDAPLMEIRPNAVVAI